MHASRKIHAPGSGFTLIEVLAALLFLAILVPAVVAALSLSSRISELSDRRAVAAELAENQLNEELIANYWQTANTTKGDFGDAYPGYSWQMTQTAWNGSSSNTTSMTELAMEVSFPVQGRAQSVRLTTLVSATVAQAQTSGTSQSTSTSSSSSPTGSTTPTTTR